MTWSNAVSTYSKKSFACALPYVAVRRYSLHGNSSGLYHMASTSIGNGTLTSIMKDLEATCNFRDLANASPDLLRSGAIYRCACPINTSSDALDFLSRSVGTVIDLRSPEEVQEFGQTAMVDKAIEITYKRIPTGLFSSAILPFVAGHIHSATATVDTDTHMDPPEKIRVHLIPLLDRTKYIKALVPRLPMRSVLKAAALKMWDSQAANDVMLGCVNDGGLNTLYEIILQIAKDEIGVTFKLLLHNLRLRRPVMFYCKAGKDRTGLIAMLLLANAGLSDSEIVADYHESDKFRSVALGDLASRKDLQKLDKSKFERAPKEAMEHTLHHIRVQWGSISAYLQACGFSQTQQSELKQLMTKA